MKDYSCDEQICDTSAQRSHLVILGAGASTAACLMGDKNGRKLPVMLDLVDTLDLADDLQKSGVSCAVDQSKAVDRAIRCSIDCLRCASRGSDAIDAYTDSKF